MTAPTTAQVLAGLATTASERHARLRDLDAEWRRLAHVGDGNTPKFTATRGENDSWWCSRCEKEVTDPGHTCVGVQPAARDLAVAHLAGKNAAQLREQYTNHQTSRTTTKTR